MARWLAKIKHSFLNELPIIKFYSILYLIGVFIGVFAAILLRDQFSEHARLLFLPENCCSFSASFFQQFFIFLLLFFLGLTAIGTPLLPLYPLYKGFSLGLLISLGIIFHQIEGFLLGFPAFFIQNFLYSFLGYFVCYSSARLSISYLQLIRGHGKHSATYQELIHHIYCILLVTPFISLGSLWECKVVPFILSLF